MNLPNHRLALVLNLFLLFVHDATYAQLNVYGVESRRCEEDLSDMHPRYDDLGGRKRRVERVFPVDGGNYRDCWFVENPEHDGGIFVPYDWGQASEPEARFARAIVEQALETQHDTLRIYSEIAGPLNNPIFISFWNEGHNSIDVDYPVLTYPDGRRASWTAVATTPFPMRETDACSIFVQHPDAYSDRGTDVTLFAIDFFKGTLAHEIAHCYISRYLSGRIPERAARSGVDKWWKEGGANYMAAHVYPGADMWRQFMAEYDFEKDIFDNPYRNWWLLGAFDYTRTFFPGLPGNTRSDIEQATSPRFEHFWRFMRAAAQTTDRQSAYESFNVAPHLKDRMYMSLALFKSGAFSGGRVCSGGDGPRLDWCTVQPDTTPAPDFTMNIGAPGRHSLAMGDLDPGKIYMVEVNLASSELSVVFPRNVDYEEILHTPGGHSSYPDQPGILLIGQMGVAGPQGTIPSYPSYTPPSDPFGTGWYGLPQLTFGYCNAANRGTRGRYLIFNRGSQPMPQVTLNLYANSKARSEEVYLETAWGCSEADCPLPDLEVLCGHRAFYDYAGEP